MFHLADLSQRPLLLVKISYELGMAIMNYKYIRRV